MLECAMEFNKTKARQDQSALRYNVKFNKYKLNTLLFAHLI